MYVAFLEAHCTLHVPRVDCVGLKCFHFHHLVFGLRRNLLEAALATEVEEAEETAEARGMPRFPLPALIETPFPRAARRHRLVLRFLRILLEAALTTEVEEEKAVEVRSMSRFLLPAPIATFLPSQTQ